MCKFIACKRLEVRGITKTKNVLVWLKKYKSKHEVTAFEWHEKLNYLSDIIVWWFCLTQLKTISLKFYSLKFNYICCYNI